MFLSLVWKTLLNSNYTHAAGHVNVHWGDAHRTSSLTLDRGQIQVLEFYFGTFGLQRDFPL